MTTSSEAPSYRYSPELAAEIETRWQSYWTDNATFQAPNPTGTLAPAAGDDLPDNKLFVQDMFPYPSGAGLHVGHPLGYIATDVYARFHRMQGTNVLHTLGYDAFGLPAEQYAVQTGTHPRTTTEANIANMERQLGRLGLGHDKRRAVATTDLDFYRWTQWIFLQIYGAWFDPRENKAKPIDTLAAAYADGSFPLPEKYEGRSWDELNNVEQADALDAHRLVYHSESTVNWCPGLGTVLANEEVTADGKSERGNFPVFRRNLKQWMMRITAYSDRLIDDLDDLDWPEKVKAMQRNWIGRSRGAEVDFQCQGHKLTVFTTRPDTLFGATYMVLAPEHELVDELVAGGTGNFDGIDERWTYGANTPADAVAKYRAAIAAKSDLERQENKEKTGVFLGTYAINPVNGAEIPVFIADYVLTGYGTGAIMSVPAHDDRDYEFAEAFGLPIVEVVAGGNISEAAFTESGTAVNSANDQGLDINGLDMAAAKAKTIEWLVAKQLGVEKIQYKLRDWLFARQRYWGEPFPIVYDEDGVAHPLPDSMLPVELPEVEDYQPVTFEPDDVTSQPHPPLAKVTDWVNVTLDLGDGPKQYTRDTNVMPQWAGSSWYQLRYIDPTNQDAFVDIENERYWTGPRPAEHGPQDPGGVDLYVGGVEHAVLHLLYSRFWHKVLFDLGHVSSWEPYRRLFNQGYIQAFAYTDSRGVYVPAAEVEEKDGKFFYNGEEVTQEYGKMGKSLKNSVSPDDICDNFGADTLRVYEMSMGPLDTSRPWATKDVVGAQRLLQRVWRLVVDEATGELRISDAVLTDEDNKAVHRAVAGVTDDYANLRDNTAVAKIIECVNYLTRVYANEPATPRAAAEAVVLMLAPVAPHIAEELWLRLGHTDTLAHGPWPSFEEKWLVDDSVEYPVQVNGKVRGHLEAPADADRDAVQELALADEHIQSLIAGKNLVKVIVVPGRMVNLVVKG
ncbi:leucine--tRNA ligase [Corynebacterium ulceribovis]|uniref:leucine--tRNA ligase n=1 Tax=Corynebacterium ulceribovis TaxID=487732 RepID=UPI000361BC48|nr:leucine--tRNA ligase [Corynebacterium ulceribovis]